MPSFLRKNNNNSKNNDMESGKETIFVDVEILMNTVTCKGVNWRKENDMNEADKAVCDSLQIAKNFGREHRNVLQSIDNLIAKNSAVETMFKVSYYKTDNGKMYRKFYMNRDGFYPLVMGFTGQEALKQKLQYIKNFNRMEELIQTRKKGE